MLPPLFNDPEVLSSASDKENLFLKTFSRNSNLDDSGIYLHVLYSRTNLRLYNISVTLKLVKNVWTWTVNCEPELSYIQDSLINVWGNLVFQNVCWPHQFSLYLRRMGEGGVQLRTILLFSVISKIFEKLSNNRLVYHLD